MTEPKLVKVQANKMNTTVHLGDGTKLRGPHEDADGQLVEGEIAEGVPGDVADAIVQNKLGKIVR